MKYRNVGKSGLKVSEIAVGSWMTDLAGTDKVQTAEETIRYAYENGVIYDNITNMINENKLQIQRR